MGPRSEGRTPIDVYPTYKLLKEQEDEWVKKGRVGVGWPRDSKDPRLSYSGPLTLPSFPKPYPTLPFSYRARRLKSFIPFQSLPSKVTVHDPWNLLAMSSPGSSLGETVTYAPGRNDDWKGVEDKIHIYRLRVIDDGMREMYEWYERVHPEQEWCVEELGRTMRGIEGSEEKGEWKVTWVEENGKERDVKVYFKNAHIQLSTGYFPFLPSLSSPSLSTSSSLSSTSPSVTRIPPPIYLLHYPPPPPLPLTLPRRQPNFSGIRPLGENTHVYFTPAKKAGDGHHSRAYKVEWVMPRGVVYPRGEDGLTTTTNGYEEDGEEEGKEEDYVLCRKCLLDDMWREIEVLRASEDSDILRDELGTLTREEIPSSSSNHNSETAEEGEVEGEAGDEEAGEANEATEKEEKGKEEKLEEEDRKEDDSDADKSEDSWVEVSSNDVVGSSPKATTPILPTDTSTLVDSDGSTLSSFSSPPSSSKTEPTTSFDSSPSLPGVDSTPTEGDGKENEKKKEKKRYQYTYTGPLRSITVKTLYQDRMRPKCIHRDPLHSVLPPTSNTSTSSQPDSYEEEADDETPPTTAVATTTTTSPLSSLPTPPAPIVPEVKVPSVSPTTTLRALAKLTYGPGYSPQCGHSGCSGSSSDHRRHMRREVWCYEWFGKDVRSGSDEDDEGDKKGRRGGKDKEVDMFLHWGKKPKMRVKAKVVKEEEVKPVGETKEEKKEVEVKEKEKEKEEDKPAEAANVEEPTPAPVPGEQTKKDSDGDDAQPAAVADEEAPKPAPIEESANPVEAAKPTADKPDVLLPPTNTTSSDPPVEVKPDTADANKQQDDAAVVVGEVEKVGEEVETVLEEVQPIVAEDAILVGEEDADDEKAEEVKQEPKGNDEPKVDAEAPVAEAKEAVEEVEVKDEETALVEEDAAVRVEEALKDVEVQDEVKAKEDANEAIEAANAPANPDTTTDAPPNPDATDVAQPDTKPIEAAEAKVEAPADASDPVQATDASPNPDPTEVVDPSSQSTDAPEPKPEPPTETPAPVPPITAPQPTTTPQNQAEEAIEYEYDSNEEDEEEGDIELGAILPRYYGYWVHDEECECRVVGREEEVEEEVKEQPKEDEKKKAEVEVKDEKVDEQEEAGKEEVKDDEVKGNEKNEEKKEEKKDVEEAKKEDDIPKEDDAAKEGEVVEAKDEVKEEKPTTVEVADTLPVKDDAPHPEPTTEATPAPAADAEKVDVDEKGQEEENDIVIVEASKEVDQDVPKNAGATAAEALLPPNPDTGEPPAEKVDAEAVVVEKAEVAESKPDDTKVGEEPKVVDGSEETKDIPAQEVKVDEAGETKVEEQPPKNNPETALDNIPPPDEPDVDRKLEIVSDEAKDKEKKDEVVEEVKDEEKKNEATEEQKDEGKKEDAVEEKKDEEKKDEEKKDEVVEEKKEEEKKVEVVEKDEAAEKKDEETKAEVVEEKKDEVVEEKKEGVVEEKKEEVVEEKKEEEPKKKEKGYFSDILLLENCGWPVDNIRLRTDEKKQIHSLFSRFHSYGWTHHSPWKRNVVYHWGPVNKHMGHRKTDRDNRQLSFRVIDFGRARYHAGYDGKGTPGVDWDDKYEDADDRKAKWERATKSEMGDVRDEFVL